ncbi:Nuclear polyadenylated RNA-binding protein 3 [Nakaseomyces bracarensis]|uniref:Nuclear polyadenylated RNA-binding protein 3 n=1 Tax=Nakaseomyces bracarensis TaxID=273131 RepID=A0ABR4NNQ7_9SACH
MSDSETTPSIEQQQGTEEVQTTNEVTNTIESVAPNVELNEEKHEVEEEEDEDDEEALARDLYSDETPAGEQAENVEEAENEAIESDKNTAADVDKAAEGKTYLDSEEEEGGEENEEEAEDNEEEGEDNEEREDEANTNQTVDSNVEEKDEVMEEQDNTMQTEPSIEESSEPIKNSSEEVTSSNENTGSDIKQSIQNEGHSHYGTHPEQKENLDDELLDKQMEYIKESKLLEKPQFQQLPDSDKISAVLRLLNSNKSTEFTVSERQPSHSRKYMEAQARRIYPRTDLSQEMTEVEARRYEEYLRGENRITEVQSLPPKSRLFIGNLPLKNVTKENLFRIFSPFGHILQINIKNAFGFIQYDNPQSVRDAIECESQEINFGKKLILEVSSSNNRPQYDHGDHGTNCSSTFISSSKRPFQGEEEEADMYADSIKKSRKRTPSCIIFVKRTADRNYANEVFSRFTNLTGLETDMIFLKPRMELRKLVNDAAYDGVWGVILVNKTRNLDIQTFYSGSRGETKFDEYVSVSADDASAIFNNLKIIRNNSGGMPTMSNNQQQYGQPPMQSIPPQAPQQGYYGGYNYNQPQDPQRQQGYYQQMPPNQGYGQPGMPPQGQGYGVPPPPPPGQPMMSTGYGRYDAPPMQPPVPNNAPMNQQQLLSAIQNLPPNVVSNLLSMAQQQQQQPDSQQQILNMIQSMQTNPQQYAQTPQHSAQQTPQQGNVSQQGGYNMMSSQQLPPQPSNNTPPPGASMNQNQTEQTPANNVQSLLDSLTQLQK